MNSEDKAKVVFIIVLGVVLLVLIGCATYYNVTEVQARQQCTEVVK